MKLTSQAPILALALLLAAAAVQAGDGKLYRWTDAQGHVHYGDQPTANAKPVTPKVLPGTAPAPDGTAPATAPAKPASVATTPDECQRQKDLLSSYRSAAKISETNSLGETREYSDEQKQKLIEVTEQNVAKACGPQS